MRAKTLAHELPAEERLALARDMATVSERAEELLRQGHSVQSVSRLTGIDRAAVTRLRNDLEQRLGEPLRCGCGLSSRHGGQCHWRSGTPSQRHLRDKRPDCPRSKTWNPHRPYSADESVRMNRRHLRLVSAMMSDADRAALAQRPVTRADCADVPRPCPWVGCHWHLYLDVSARGAIKFNFPHLQPEDMAESCALDVADRGPHRLEDVGQIINVTRERVRQIQVRATSKLDRARLAELLHEGSIA